MLSLLPRADHGWVDDVEQNVNDLHTHSPANNCKQNLSETQKPQIGSRLHSSERLLAANSKPALHDESIWNKKRICSAANWHSMVPFRAKNYIMQDWLSVVLSYKGRNSLLCKKPNWQLNFLATYARWPCQGERCGAAGWYHLHQVTKRFFDNFQWLWQLKARDKDQAEVGLASYSQSAGEDSDLNMQWQERLEFLPARRLGVRLQIFV